MALSWRGRDEELRNYSKQGRKRELENARLVAKLASERARATGEVLDEASFGKRGFTDEGTGRIEPLPKKESTPTR